MPSLKSEERQFQRLATTREPAGAPETTTPETEANQAVTDAVIIIAACWVLLFILAYSVRRHNV